MLALIHRLSEVSVTNAKLSSPFFRKVLVFGGCGGEKVRVKMVRGRMCTPLDSVLVCYPALIKWRKAWEREIYINAQPQEFQ